jgi:cation:H+ antiporter
MLGEVLTSLAIAAVATGSIWTGSSLLERESELSSGNDGRRQVGQGTVLGAVRASCPELSSAVIPTVRHGAFDIGGVAVVGSTSCNGPVIRALSDLLADGVRSDPNPVYNRAQFDSWHSSSVSTAGVGGGR